MLAHLSSKLKIQFVLEKKIITSNFVNFQTKNIKK